MCDIWPVYVTDGLSESMQNSCSVLCNGATSRTCYPIFIEISCQNILVFRVNIAVLQQIPVCSRQVGVVSIHTTPTTLHPTRSLHPEITALLCVINVDLADVSKYNLELFVLQLWPKVQSPVCSGSTAGSTHLVFKRSCYPESP